jgi:hypothetical protein
LSDQKVIQRVTTSFVPVAVNLYKVRQAKDAGGELFRSVRRQKDQYQGIWIVSPAGKVLAGHHEFQSRETWTKEVLDTLTRLVCELRFGSIEIVVHEGRITQIERREKVRFGPSGPVRRE